MINSIVINYMKPYFRIIEKSKGKTIGELKRQLHITKEKMKKGASGLIVENVLGIKNNNIDDADLPEIGCEVKILPLQINQNGVVKVKEPTAIQMIDYFAVADETWETAKIRKKITLTFWVVYLAKDKGITLNQDDYVIIDYMLEKPNLSVRNIFKEDWEEIQRYIQKGLADKLSCSMGTFIEPKTKGINNQDKRLAPNGKGGTIMARRRAFYYKKNYTDNEILPNIDLTPIKKRIPKK